MGVKPLRGTIRGAIYGAGYTIGSPHLPGAQGNYVTANGVRNGLGAGVTPCNGASAYPSTR